MYGTLYPVLQIARCFRDETNNPEKQPEFTQLDMEMSFVNMESILQLIERLILFSWPTQLNAPPAIPFPRMTYKNAMDTYGSDKPDTRFGMKFMDMTEFSRKNRMFTALLKNEKTTVRAFVAPRGAEFCRGSFQKAAQVLLQKEHRDVALAFIRLDESGSIASTTLSAEVQEELLAVTRAKANDLIVLCVGQGEACLKALGRIRLETAERLEESGQKIHTTGMLFFNMIEIDWLIDWLIDRIFVRLIGWLVEWLVDELIGWFDSALLPVSNGERWMVSLLHGF